MAQVAPSVSKWQYLIDGSKVQRVLLIALANSMQVLPVVFDGYRYCCRMIDMNQRPDSILRLS